MMTENYVNPLKWLSHRTKAMTTSFRQAKGATGDFATVAGELAAQLERHDERLDSIEGQLAATLDGLGNVRVLGAESHDPEPQPERVLEIIDRVQSGRVALEDISDNFSPEVSGLSGRKFRTLVAQLVETMGEFGSYLEIGTYQGKTICTSAALNRGIRHIGVDNFSYRDGTKNRARFEALVLRLGLANIEFIEADLFEWLPQRSYTGERDIAVYYFDASHDYRSQLLALLHGAKIVVRGGIMIVDDCNYRHVRAATYDFCELHTDWALVFERYTQSHPDFASEAVREEMEEGWWNGVHILVHDPLKKIPRLPRQKEPSLAKWFRQQHEMDNCVTDSVVSRQVEITLE